MLFFSHGFYGNLSHVPNEMHTDKNTKHGEPKMQYKSLSKSNQSVIAACRDILFGSITDLEVVDGEIHTTPQTRRFSTIRLDKGVQNIGAGAAGDFTLCPAQEQLIAEVARRGKARITVLDIRDGRPANVSFEEAMPAF